jgi:hypothetical protein
VSVQGERRSAQEDWTTLSTYSHPSQELFVFRKNVLLFPVLERCRATTFAYAIINPFTNFFYPASHVVDDEKQRAGHRPMRVLHGQRADDYPTKTAVMLTI